MQSALHGCWRGDRKPRGHQGDYTAREKRAELRVHGPIEVEVKLTDTVRRYGGRMRQERVSFWFKALADIFKGKQNLQGPALIFPSHAEQANPDLGLLSRNH